MIVVVVDEVENVFEGGRMTLWLSLEGRELRKPP